MPRHIAFITDVAEYWIPACAGMTPHFNALCMLDCVDCTARDQSFGAMAFRENQSRASPRKSSVTEISDSANEA
jgi:hypothetical protein